MAHWKNSSPPWALRLGHKFFSVAPYRTALIVASSLVSQVSLLLAFLLPLKIVMLLGSESVPSYMPPPFDTMHHDTMIIVLSILALASYGTHLLANRVTEHASTSGAKRLLEASRKIVLFENQDTIASMAYRKYAEALSGLTFSILALAALAWLYPEVALIIFGLAGAAAMATTIAAKRSDEMRHTLADNAPVYVSAASGVGFLAIFVFIVVDFLAFTPPNFLVAIITIILGRQLLAQAGLSVLNKAFLNKQEQKISALFFHDARFDLDIIKPRKNIWNFLEKESKDNALKDIYASACDLNPETTSYNWVQTNVRNVIAIHLQDETTNRQFLLKLFDKNKKSAATHEATLLADFIHVDDLPAPTTSRITTLRGFNCHIFDVTNLHLQPSTNPAVIARQLTMQLINVRPSKDLIERYTRSKKMLWENLDDKMISWLRLVAEPEHKNLISDFERALRLIKTTLKELPLCVHVPFPIRNGLVYQSEGDRTILGHWEGWTLAPQGSGWPVNNEKDLDLLSKKLTTELSDKCEETRSKRVKKIQLAASMYALSSKYSKQQHTDALELLKASAPLISEIEKNR